MKITLLCMTLLLGQMITHQGKEVVHLAPHADGIDVAFSGKLVELIGAPPVLYLPSTPPKPDPVLGPWNVDNKNLGPAAVTIEDRARFALQVNAGQTVHIYVKNRGYSTTP